MSHSSRGFHSHTIGKTLLFLSVLKSQPPGIPSRKEGSLSSPTRHPGRKKKKKNPTKKTTLGRDCLPRMDTKCTKNSLRLPPNGPHLDPGSCRAQSGQGGLMPGSVGRDPLRAFAAGRRGDPRAPPGPKTNAQEGTPTRRGAPPLAR